VKPRLNLLEENTSLPGPGLCGKTRDKMKESKTGSQKETVGMGGRVSVWLKRHCEIQQMLLHLVRLTV